MHCFPRHTAFWVDKLGPSISLTFTRLSMGSTIRILLSKLGFDVVSGLDDLGVEELL